MTISAFRRLLAGATLVAATAVHAAPYSGLYIFSDSLGDSGNNSLAGAGPFPQVITGNSYIPTFTYLPAGTYSNGQVWASSLASMLGGIGQAAYSAANIYLDTFARRSCRAGQISWLSINWDVWRTHEQAWGSSGPGNIPFPSESAV